jgi:hypothetical protein
MTSCSGVPLLVARRNDEALIFFPVQVYMAVLLLS